MGEMLFGLYNKEGEGGIQGAVATYWVGRGDEDSTLCAQDRIW